MKLQEILERLKEPIPASKMSSKTLKGNTITFVSWYNLVDLLDERAGLTGWEWKVTIVSTTNQLIIVGTLTLHGEDKSLTREATGQEDLELSGYGDPSSNAEAMALRRCCAKFGLGLDLWRKDSKPSTNGQKPTGKGELTREQWLAKRAGN